MNFINGITFPSPRFLSGEVDFYNENALELFPYLYYWIGILLMWGFTVTLLSIKYKKKDFYSCILLIIPALGFLPAENFHFWAIFIFLVFYFLLLTVSMGIMGKRYLQNRIPWLRKLKEKRNKKIVYSDPFDDHPTPLPMKEGFSRRDKGILLADVIALLGLIISCGIMLLLFQSPDYLVSLLYKKDSPIIREKLLEMGPSALPSLIRGLNSKDERVQATCLRLMTEIPGDIPQDKILTLLKKRTTGHIYNPRLEAVMLLGRKGKGDAIPSILDALSEEYMFIFTNFTDPRNYSTTFTNAGLKAVGEIEYRQGEDISIEYIKKKSQHETHPLRACTWSLMAVILGDDDSIKSLENAYGQIQKTARLQIISSLAGNQDPRSLTLLFWALKDKSTLIRKKAVEILGSRKEEIVEFYLIQTLGDPSPEVRISAYRTLISITGRHWDFDPYAPEPEREEAKRVWMDWWIKKVRGEENLPPEPEITLPPEMDIEPP